MYETRVPRRWGWLAPALLIAAGLLLAAPATAATPTGTPPHATDPGGRLPQAAPGHLSSLSGDGLTDLTAVQPSGNIEAYRNVTGFTNMPWAPGSLVVGTGFAGADRVRFADLDGDGKADLLYVQPDGRVRAWQNVGGYVANPWTATSVIIATGFSDPTRARFADLDGDGKADAAYIQVNGNVDAWHNVNGYAAMPWGGASVLLATGFTDPTRAQFTDLDADGRAEAVYVATLGYVLSWHNAGGFAPLPWAPNSTIIASGFSDPTRTKFADLNGDGRSEIAYVQVGGTIEAWNLTGGPSVIVGLDFFDPAVAVFA